MAEINIGDALSKPVDIMQRNPGIIVPALIPAIASLIFAAIFGSVMMGAGMYGYGMNPMLMQGFFGILAVYIIVLIILSLIAEGAIVSIAYSELKGKSMNYMDGINHAVSKIVPLLISAIIIAIGIFIGTLLLVIPGLIFALLVIFTIQEVMIAGKDATSAISGSIELVKRNFGNVLIYAVILMILASIVSMALGMVPFIGNAITSLLITPYIGTSITYAYLQLTEN
jgi:hypothetical protein